MLLFKSLAKRFREHNATYPQLHLNPILKLGPEEPLELQYLWEPIRPSGLVPNTSTQALSVIFRKRSRSSSLDESTIRCSKSISRCEKVLVAIRREG